MGDDSRNHLFAPGLSPGWLCCHCLCCEAGRGRAAVAGMSPSGSPSAAKCRKMFRFPCPFPFPITCAPHIAGLLGTHDLACEPQSGRWREELRQTHFLGQLVRSSSSNLIPHNNNPGSRPRFSSESRDNRAWRCGWRVEFCSLQGGVWDDVESGRGVPGFPCHACLHAVARPSPTTQPPRSPCPPPRNPSQHDLAWPRSPCSPFHLDSQQKPLFQSRHRMPGRAGGRRALTQQISSLRTIKGMGRSTNEA